MDKEGEKGPDKEGKSTEGKSEISKESSSPTVKEVRCFIQATLNIKGGVYCSRYVCSELIIKVSFSFP